MEKYTTANFEKDFPTDDACLEWVFTNRWPDGVTCEKCQVVKIAVISFSVQLDDQVYMISMIVLLP